MILIDLLFYFCRKKVKTSWTLNTNQSIN